MRSQTVNRNLNSFLLLLVFLFRLNDSIANSNIMFMLTIVLAGFGIMLKLRDLKMTGRQFAYPLWLAGFLLLFGISAAWATYPEITVQNFAAVTGRYICFIFISLCMTDLEDVKRVLLLFSLAVILTNLSFLVLYGPQEIIQARSPGFKSRASNNNGIGMSSALAVLALFFCSDNKLTRKKLVKWFAYAFLLLFVVLSGSKKAFVMLPLFLGLYYVISAENILTDLAVVLGCGVLVLAVLKVPVLYDIVGNRLESLVSGLSDMMHLDSIEAQAIRETRLNTSDRTRVRLILWGLEWIRESPFIGHGMANYAKTCLEKTGTNLYSHNNYIEVAFGLGLTGLLYYYALHIRLIGCSLKRIKKSKAARLALALVLLQMVLDFGMVSYFELQANLLLITACRLTETARQEVLTGRK